MFRKGSKSSYKLPNGDIIEIEFLTSIFEDGYPYSVGIVNNYRKEISPCHGYHYPNRCATSLMNYALKLGYTYVDSEMPSIKNKTLLKKWYKSAKKQGIFLGQIKEFRPEQGVLIKYEIVDIINQKFCWESGATWYMTYVAMKKSKTFMIMKYICSHCKTVYEEKNLCIDSMGGYFCCPKCRGVGRVFTEKALLEKINDYKELLECLHS